MKQFRFLHFLFSIVVVQLLLVSCKKESVPPGTASLTIINAVVGSSPLVTNFSSDYTLPDYYKNAMRLNYSSFNSDNQFNAYSGLTNLMVYQYPDTLEHSSPLFSFNFYLPVGSIHTLFLTGLVSAPDTVFTTDQPPYHPASDSSIGIRFINISPGSSPISVNISGNANGSEVSSLSYKNVTGFKSYPANSTIDHYTFEIRDAGTGNFISNYTLNGVNNGSTGVNNLQNQYRYRNFTIVLTGEPGSQQILFINNY